MTAGLTLFFYWLRLVWLRKVRPDASLKVKVATLFVISPFVVYPFVYSPVWWLRGLTGDLSIISTIWLGLTVYRMITGNDMFAGNERKMLTWSIAGLGLLFYPLALGVGHVDPYAWGYANGYMLAAVLGLSVLAWMRGLMVIAWMLLLSILSWNLELLESNNLWDYLLDPFVFFFLAWSVLKGVLDGE